MTWIKHGVEFVPQMMDLSNGAFRLHVEVIHHLYQAEDFALIVSKRHLGRISSESGSARELVMAGFWKETETNYEIVHHAEVIRQSLNQQLSHREKERNRQRGKRGSKPDEESSSSSPDVGTNVGANVADMSHPTQTDSHTDNQQIKSEQIERASSQQDDEWPAPTSIPKSKSVDCACGTPLTTAVQQQRGICNRCWTKGRRAA